MFLISLKGKTFILPADALEPVNDKLLEEWRDEQVEDAGRPPGRPAGRSAGRPPTELACIPGVDDGARPSARASSRRPQMEVQQVSSAPMNDNHVHFSLPEPDQGKAPTKPSSATAPSSAPTGSASSATKPTQLLSRDTLKRFMQKNQKKVANV